MALQFQVTHTVTFGTFAGEDYQWELDLLRSYDDDFAAPAWTLDTTVQVTASNSPIEVEWMSDRDTYKPIIGSKAVIDLHRLPNGPTLPRFTSAGQFEYKARLRYRRNGESTLNDYWCGYIQSSDGSESVTDSAPITSFTAVDNLAGLEDTMVTVDVASIAEVNVFDKVLEAVYQTGLNLDVLVESGIRSSLGDALTTSTAHPYSMFTSEEENVLLRERMTNKELIEGYLSAFNCKIFQSAGKWFVVNASTHNGVGVDETSTFQKFEVVNGAYVSNGTEVLDLTYNVGGTYPDLLVADSDLQLNTRRPFGSVECRPTNVRTMNFMTNGLLQDGTNGLLTHASSADPLYRGSGYNHPLAKNSIYSLRNVFKADQANDIWAMTEPLNVDVNAPIDIGFDWKIIQLSNQIVSLNYCVVLTTSNMITVTGDYSNNPNSYTQTSSSNTFTYNFDNQEWDNGFKIYSDYKKSSSKTAWQGREVSGTTGEWFNVKHTLAAGEYYDAGNGDFTELEGTLTIYWMYPQSKRPGRSRWEGSDTHRVGAAMTNFSVQNKYANNVKNAVFERVQAEYTKTEVYKPTFADGLPASVYGRLIQEGFWKKNQASGDSTTLERIVTQQKLNDYRDEFKYYEGTLINISSDPICPHHKVSMNWNNYNEPTNLIFNGGTFTVKEGKFDMTMYVPNQSTDIAPGDGTVNDDGTTTPGFFNFDVDLVADNFIGLSEKVTYSLALVPQGLDDLGNLFTTNPLTIEEHTNGVLQITGQSGDKSSHVVKITIDPNFEASASNMSFFDGTNQGTGIWALLEDGEDTAEQLSNVQFRDLGKELEVTFDIELPNKSEFEQIRIAGEVDTLVASNREVDVTFSLANNYGGSIVNPTRNLRGIPGTNAFINCIITPDTGKEFDASAFSATVPSYMTVKSVEQLGTSVYIEFEVLFQETNEIASVLINGATSTILPSGDLSTVTLTLSESISNVSLSRTSLAITGVVGTTAVYDVTAYAADGFELNSSNFSISEAESWLNMGNATGGGETVLIPLEITFPSADASGTATIAGSAQASGADTVSITLNFTNSISGTSLTDSSEVFILNAGQQISYTNTITPDRGTFIEAGDVTITESSSVVAFSKSDAGGGSVNISTSVTAPASDVTIPITLTGSTSSEPYLASLNISETLPNGRLATNSLSQRFGSTDTNISFSGVTIAPVDDGTAYASGTTFTVTGGTASNYSYTSGNVSFDLLVSLPVFNTNNPIGDVSVPVSIVSAIKPPGVSGTYCTTTVPHGGIPATGGTISIFVDTDGAWETGGNGSINGGGRYAPITGTGPSVINVELPYLANNFNAFSVGIVVRSLDGTNSNQVNLAQSDAFGQRIVYVATLPTIQQPGILYITPLV